MIDAKTFPGWKNFIAFAYNLKSVLVRQRHIRKIAIVTDTKIPSVIPGLLVY